MRFWSNAAIEDLTAGRLAEFERKSGRKVEPPVPVDLIAEVLFNLCVCYEPIAAPPGHKVWAGLNPETRTVFVNEEQRAVFKEKPGLERFSVGHEVGHWDLFEKDRDTRTGEVFGERDPDCRLDLRTASGATVKCIPFLWQQPDVPDVLRYLERSVDSPDVASAVNRYASALLMPERLLLSRYDRQSITSWHRQYEVALEFGVTISALMCRLKRLKRVYVKSDKTIVPGTEAEHAGQTQLF